MRRPIQLVVCAAALTCLFVGTVRASTAVVQDSAVDRWSRLSEAEREQLRERFRLFKELAPDERSALEARAAGLESRIAEVQQNLAPSERAALASLPFEERRSVLKSFLHARARFDGLGLSISLRQGLREELRSAAPERRAQLLDAARRRCAAGVGELHAPRRFGLSPDELDELRALTPEQRIERMRERLLERIAARREARSEHAKSVDSGTGLHGKSAQRPDVSLDSEIAGELIESTRPRFSDHLELRGLERDVRHDVIAARDRERVLDAARNHAGVDARLLAELESLDAQTLRRELRRSRYTAERESLRSDD